MIEIQNPKLSFGNLKLELEICLGFGIWDFRLTTFLRVDSVGSVIQNE